VEKNSPGSHSNKGWEQFTDVIVDFLNKKEDPLVFMLWGNYAKSKGIKINSSKHWVLKTSHPSPLSVRHGFFGCDHFIQANEFLISVGEKPIDWKIS
jgi:uracil-DNA glycosylase